MTEKRFVPIFDGFDKRVVGAKDNGVIISFMDMFDLLNELAEENKGIQDKIFKLLDWLETEKGVSRKEIKKWWNGDVE